MDADDAVITGSPAQAVEVKKNSWLSGEHDHSVPCAPADEESSAADSELEDSSNLVASSACADPKSRFDKLKAAKLIRFKKKKKSKVDPKQSSILQFLAAAADGNNKSSVKSPRKMLKK